MIVSSTGIKVRKKDNKSRYSGLGDTQPMHPVSVNHAHGMAASILVANLRQLERP